MAAELTIPSLLPPEGADGNTELYQPYQSEGADGVNNLAGKLMMVLFPPGTKFFRFSMGKEEEAELEALTGEGFGAAKTEFERVLSKIEQSIMDKIEQTAQRPVLYECLQHVIVTGNGLLHILPDYSLKFHRLDRFVVKRDTEGSILEIIVKETMAKIGLPSNVLEIVEANTSPYDDAGEEEVEIFTWVRRQPKGNYKVHQEVCGTVIPGSEGTYPKGKLAWTPVRWKRISGEDYGRGMCEEYMGDLRGVEKAAKSISEFAAMCAKILAFISESSNLTPREIATAVSGDVFRGDPEDIGFLQVDKSQDFRVVLEAANKSEQRLARAFMKFQGRDAERVTAEEIRLLAQELESTLGGVYSLLSDELQRPLVVRIFHQMQRSKKLPPFPEGAVVPQIVTGLEGLGRSSDLQKLKMFVTDIGTTFGPDAVQKYVNPEVYLKRLATSLGIEEKGLVRSASEVQQIDQQAQMAQMAEKLGGPTIKAASDQALAAQQAPNASGVA